MKRTVFAGTYTSHNSKGIYRFSFEDGILSDPSLLCEIKNPKYIQYQDGIITTSCDFDQRSGVALVNEKGEIISSKAFENGTSCYVTRKDDRIYTANYHAGTYSVLRIVEDRLKFENTTVIQDGGGCHQVLLWNDLILVPSLFLDRVVIYDQQGSRKGSIRFNQGTGPRHGVFSHDNEYLYLVSELSNELFVIKTGTWEILHSISILPNGEKHKRDSAAIRLSDDGHHLYISTRTKDIISVVELNDQVPTLVQVVSCGGKHPRDFILLDGYLLSANRYSDTVVSFKVNEDGSIGKMVSSVEVPEAVSLAYK